MQPIFAGAGQAASALGVVTGVGTVAAGAAPLLSAVSKLQVGNVPQAVKGFDWYVEKVTVPPSTQHGVMQGLSGRYRRTCSSCSAGGSPAAWR
jgi:hypothetical protein